MKKIFLLSIIIPMFSSIIVAQSLRGKITDNQLKNSIEGVSVLLKETGVGTITDKTGTYSFSKLKKGSYTIEVRHLGYASQIKKVQINNDETVNFSLTAESFLQEQVVVTANKISINRDQVPMNISVITEEEINQSNESNVLPVISREIPGLFITEKGVSGFGLSDGAAGQISVRGVGGSGTTFPILVLIDGQPQFMGIFGHPIPDSYASSDFEKVEVIKGPASILYGTNAMGGVINLITKQAKQDGFHFKGRGMIGSYSTWKLNGSVAYKKKKLNTFASWNQDETDGQRANSAFKINNGFLKLDYDFNEHFSFMMNSSISDFKAYDPGSIYADDPSIYDNNSFLFDIQRTNSYANFSNKFDHIEGGLKLYYMHGKHFITNGPDADWNSIDENMGLSFYQGIKPFPGCLISVGIDLKKYGGKGSPVVTQKFENGHVVGVEPSPYNNRWIDISETGTYVIVQQQLWDKLSLNAGIRYENHTLFGNEWIPQFGLAYKTTENTRFKASISKGYRSPSIRELYLFPPANQDLQPEEMWNYELGWSQFFLNKRLSTRLDVFLSKGSNLITTLPNSSPPPTILNVNSGDFKHDGFEAEARFTVSPKLKFNGNYSYLHMDSPKVSAPKHQLFLGANYQLNDLNFYLNMQYIGELYTNISPETTQSYTLFNTTIDYQLSPSIQLFISAKNLFDKEYQTQYGYPMPGLTIFSGINLNF